MKMQLGNERRRKRRTDVENALFVARLSTVPQTPRLQLVANSNVVSKQHHHHRLQPHSAHTDTCTHNWSLNNYRVGQLK